GDPQSRSRLECYRVGSTCRARMATGSERAFAFNRLAGSSFHASHSLVIVAKFAAWGRSPTKLRLPNLLASSQSFPIRSLITGRRLVVAVLRSSEVDLIIATAFWGS